ncbi:unnamed protein product [Debaryomyces fabryi]|nr:unnamed protein product [Debaryomyces fabryi]
MTIIIILYFFAVLNLKKPISTVKEYLGVSKFIYKTDTNHNTVVRFKTIDSWFIKILHPLITAGRDDQNLCTQKTLITSR